jgi:hypothetical protein
MRHLQDLSQRLYEFASLQKFFVLTLIMVILGILMISPISASDELKALSNGQDVPDTQFWRSADALYDQLTDYGETGRRLYLRRVSPVDIFIPPAQMLFLSVAISLLLPILFSPVERWQQINLLPIPAMLGDYLENWSMIVIMASYPARLDFLATAATFFTAIKFIFSFISIFIILLGLILWLLRRLNVYRNNGEK